MPAKRGHAVPAFGRNRMARTENSGCAILCPVQPCPEGVRFDKRAARRRLACRSNQRCERAERGRLPVPVRIARLQRPVPSATIEAESPASHTFLMSIGQSGIRKSNPRAVRLSVRILPPAASRSRGPPIYRASVRPRRRAVLRDAPAV